MLNELLGVLALLEKIHVLYEKFDNIIDPEVKAALLTNLKKVVSVIHIDLKDKKTE